MLRMKIIRASIERAWFLADLTHNLCHICSINTHSSVLGGICAYVLIMRKEAYLRPLERKSSFRRPLQSHRVYSP